MKKLSTVLLWWFLLGGNGVHTSFIQVGGFLSEKDCEKVQSQVKNLSKLIRTTSCFEADRKMEKKP